MLSLGDTRLIVFFTEGISLRVWDTAGILEREIELYQRLLDHVAAVTFVTYGDTGELTYLERLRGISVLCNRWKLPTRVYSLLSPLLHYEEMRRASFYRTVQLTGARAAFIAKTIYGKKMIGRCGYLRTALHQDETWMVDRWRPRNYIFSYLDELAFRKADRVVVTTEAIRGYALRDYGIAADKIEVIPNYVVTELFRPDPTVEQHPNRICFVGNLKSVKNPDLLLEAIRGLDVELVMIGSGVMLEDLQKQAKATGSRAQFLGRIPNYRLPIELNQSTLFVLPSRHEGHPKALLEAMACGLPVIGTDVPGIRSLIQHGETGYLCDTSPESIRQAIVELVDKKALRASLGWQARQFVVDRFSIEKVLERELALLVSLLNQT